MASVIAVSQRGAEPGLSGVGVVGVVVESQHPVGVAMLASGQSVGVATEQRGVGSGESKGRGRPGHRPSPGGRSLVLL